jgi:ribosomal protein L37AE/L43A
VPAADTTCGHCGKPGTTQLADGSWACKKRAYELGAIEHTAERLKAMPEVELCSWCERRPSRRTFQGYHYCGACASEAGLPPEEEAA